MIVRCLYRGMTNPFDRRTRRESAARIRSGDGLALDGGPHEGRGPVRRSLNRARTLLDSLSGEADLRQRDPLIVRGQLDALETKLKAFD